MRQAHANELTAIRTEIRMEVRREVARAALSPTVEQQEDAHIPNLVDVEELIQADVSHLLNAEVCPAYKAFVESPTPMTAVLVQKLLWNYSLPFLPCSHSCERTLTPVRQTWLVEMIHTLTRGGRERGIGSHGNVRSYFGAVDMRLTLRAGETSTDVCQRACTDRPKLLADLATMWREPVEASIPARTCTRLHTRIVHTLTRMHTTHIHSCFSMHDRMHARRTM